MVMMRMEGPIILTLSSRLVLEFQDILKYAIKLYMILWGFNLRNSRTPEQTNFSSIVIIFQQVLLHSHISYEVLVLPILLHLL